MLLKVVKIHSAAMLGLDGITKGDDLVGAAYQKNRVEIGTADADIRGHEPKTGSDSHAAIQSFGVQLTAIGVQHLIRLPI